LGDQRKSAAVHEAGHAVAHVERSVKFRYVTLLPRDKRVAGAVRPVSGRISLLDESFIGLAGPLANACGFSGERMLDGSACGCAA
jgi:hypothetical protein